MLPEDITDRRVSQAIAHVGQRALDPVVSPDGIVFGEPQDHFNDHLADSGASGCVRPAVAVVLSHSDQRPMPPENGVGSEQRADLLETLPAEKLAPHRQSPSLVIVEQDPFLADLLLESPVLCNRVMDHLLLLALDPADQDEETDVPRLKNEVHWSANVVKRWKARHLDAVPTSHQVALAKLGSHQRPGGRYLLAGPRLRSVGPAKNCGHQTGATPGGITLWTSAEYFDPTRSSVGNRAAGYNCCSHGSEVELGWA